jgi:hypothetical protein
MLHACRDCLFVLLVSQEPGIGDCSGVSSGIDMALTLVAQESLMQKFYDHSVREGSSLRPFCTSLFRLHSSNRMPYLHAQCDIAEGCISESFY